ncbi:hypothetical protein PFISCL1PPCAC_1639, partial [Pristionchus fissidentatus]
TVITPSNGGRFVCTICPDYDLCEKCVVKGLHKNHALVGVLDWDTIIPLSTGKGSIVRGILNDVTDVECCFTLNAVVDKENKEKDEGAAAAEVRSEPAESSDCSRDFNATSEALDIDDNDIEIIPSYGNY